ITGAKGGDSISLALRPEAGSIAEGARGDTALPGKVVSRSFLGSVIRTKLRVGEDIISFDMFNDPGMIPPVAGESVTLRFAAKDLLVIRE
ncbi:TOBE domain-containing protein, partial [Sinorhizobium medicae]